MALPAAAPRAKKHHRKIDIEGYEREDGFWDIDVHMVDTRTYDCSYDEFHRDGLIRAGEPVHDMWLRFTIDIDFEIHAVQAASDQTPFAICPSAAASMQNLVGLRIGAGWLKQARERVGPEIGCTHLMDLLGQFGATAYQTLHAELEKRARSLPARERPPIIDTCLGLSSSGEVVKNLWPQFYVKPEDGGAES